MSLPFFRGHFILFKTPVKCSIPGTYILNRLPRATMYRPRLPRATMYRPV